MKKVYPEVLPEGSFAMDKLWRRQDLLLLVSGSLPCIRGVYSRALKLNNISLILWRYLPKTIFWEM